MGPNQILGWWSSDCKKYPTTKREGSEIAELQKGVNHLQIRSKEHLEFFRSFYTELQKGVNYLQIRSKEHSEFFHSFCNLRDQAVTLSNHSSHQKIESEDFSIKFRDCTHTFNINTKLNLLLIFCLIYFRLEICVYKFLARPVGPLYLSSLSPNYNYKAL